MPSVSPVPQALAPAARFQTRFPYLCEDGPGADPVELQQMMVEATAEIEDRIDRRLAPFTGHVETGTLYGISPFGAGLGEEGPLDIYGSLGLSQAQAFGTNNLVREYHLLQTAPHYPELWSYDIASITLHLNIGSLLQVDPGTVEGPWPDTGFMRFRLGTFAPEGTSIVIVYNGGYTVGIPPSLSRACLYQTALNIILDQEPQSRKGMDLNELNAKIDSTLAGWARA